MQNNAKYTVLEILNELGTTFPFGEDQVTAEEIIGKTRIRIGGTGGYVDPNKEIKIQAGTNVLDVVVGNERYEVTLNQGDAQTMVSPGARKSLDAKGERVKIQNKRVAEAKAKAKK